MPRVAVGAIGRCGASRQTPPARADAKKSKEEKRVEAQLRADATRSCAACATGQDDGIGIAAAERRLEEINAPPGPTGHLSDRRAGEIAGRAGQSTQVYLSRLNREWEEALTQLEKYETVDDGGGGAAAAAGSAVKERFSRAAGRTLDHVPASLAVLGVLK